MGHILGLFEMHGYVYVAIHKVNKSVTYICYTRGFNQFLFRIHALISTKHIHTHKYPLLEKKPIRKVSILLDVHSANTVDWRCVFISIHVTGYSPFTVLGY